MNTRAVPNVSQDTAARITTIQKNLLLTSDTEAQPRMIPSDVLVIAAADASASAIV